MRKNKENKSKIAYGGHLVSQNEAKIYAWGGVVAINIIWKFSDYIFLNEGDRELFVKTWWMHGQTDSEHFIISRPGPIGWWEIKTFLKHTPSSFCDVCSSLASRGLFESIVFKVLNRINLWIKNTVSSMVMCIHCIYNAIKLC